MAKPISALPAHTTAPATGVMIEDIHPFTLLQIAAWPDDLATTGAALAQATGCNAAPKPGQSASGPHCSLLRVEPLKWWAISQSGIGSIAAGTRLDLSHARSWLRISGECAPQLLNNFLPLDLRSHAFRVGTVANSAIHHVGVTLWRCEDGYQLLIPRSFAASLWEMLSQSAMQYR